MGVLWMASLYRSMVSAEEEAVSINHNAGSVRVGATGCIAMSPQQKTWRLFNLDGLSNDDDAFEFHMLKRPPRPSAFWPKLLDKPDFNRPRLPQSLQFSSTSKLLFSHHNKQTIANHVIDISARTLEL